MEHSATTSPEDHIYQHSDAWFEARIEQAYDAYRAELEDVRAEYSRSSADLLTRMDALIARTAIAKANAGVQ